MSKNKVIIDDIRIVLQDNSGQDLEVVDWFVGKKLVKLGFANLLFKLPCTIRLSCKTKVFDELKRGDRPWRRFRRRPIYGNIQFQSCDGKEIFRNGDYKAFWYMARGLVVPVRENPPIFRFVGETNGNGNFGDDFYSSLKVNACVRCGAEHTSKNKHSRHHILPRMFRKHLDEKFKSHSYHDIVILCKKCHKEYETYADELKDRLYEYYKVPFERSTNRFSLDNKDRKARGLAFAIVKHGHKMSVSALESIKNRLQELIGEPLTEDSINKIAFYKVEEVCNDKFIDLGKWVVERIDDLQEFVVMWRKHFVEKMKPKFMCPHWDINRPVV